MILDEPTNHLDIGYQIQLMDLVKSLNITTLSAIHDMNMASMYCDYLIVMKDGKIKNCGSVKEVITEEMLKEIFGVNAYVGVNPMNNKLQVSFMHSHSHINGIGHDHIHEDGFTGEHEHFHKHAKDIKDKINSNLEFIFFIYIHNLINGMHYMDYVIYIT